MKKLLFTLIFLYISLSVFSQYDKQFFYCYQYILTKDKFKKSVINKITDDIPFKDNDTILSIGASGSCLEVQFKLKNDRLKFWLEDIDSTCFNKKNTALLVKYHAEEFNKNITNDFTLVYGTEKSTLLSENSFNYILLSRMFHHIEYKKEMLQDLHKVLRNDGVMYLLESVATKKGAKHKGCGELLLWKSELEKILNENGFEVTASKGYYKNRKSMFTLFTVKKKR
ncbi:MAG: class I SAM-dependent methyltransferase [Bacteroidia bacterium]